MFGYRNEIVFTPEDAWKQREVLVVISLTSPALCLEKASPKGCHANSIVFQMKILILAFSLPLNAAKYSAITFHMQI